MRLLLLMLPAVVFADSYPRQPGIDVQHYIFRVTLSDQSSEITGRSTAVIRFVQGGVSQLFLDLAGAKDGKGMTVTAVTSGGAPVRYQHADDRLSITVPSSPEAGEQREFTVSYRGVPANGLHIVNNKFGERCFFSWNW